MGPAGVIVRDFFLVCADNPIVIGALPQPQIRVPVLSVQRARVLLLVNGNKHAVHCTRAWAGRADNANLH